MKQLKSVRRYSLVAAIGLGTMGMFGGAAQAVTTHTFNLDVSSGFASAPFGTVKVYELGGGTLQFLISLSSGFYIQGGTNAFVFSLNDTIPSVTYAGDVVNAGPLPKPPYTGVTTPQNSSADQTLQMDGLGSWMYEVDNNQGSGGSGAFDQTLNFTIHAAGLDFSDLIKGAPAPGGGPTPKPAYWLAMDICQGTGTGTCTATGYAAASDFTTKDEAPPRVTPLPGSLPLFASGLGALGLLRWRKKLKSKLA